MNTLQLLDICDSQRRNHVSGYVEDVYITYDSIWDGDKRLSAFVITNKDNTTYKVSQRHRIKYNNIDKWDYDQVSEFDTVADAKQWIFEHINRLDTQIMLTHGIIKD